MPVAARLRWFGLIFIALLALGSRAAAAQSAGDGQVEEGARLFAENCAVCHGADGQGRVGATLAKDWPSIRPDLRVQATIAEGIAGSPMPAWSEANGGPLDEAQIEALTAYILSWESGKPIYIAPAPVYPPRPQLTAIPAVSGDPNRGGQLFDQNCVVCHGANGEGRIGATLAKPWSSLRPDLSISAIIARGVEGSPMPAWEQAQGGPLSETEVADLTAFILTLPAAAELAPQAEAEFTPSWLAGWGGVLLTLAMLIALAWLALTIQARGNGRR
ncbi:MAG: c-type cytochrome [Chloroflexi bacterium]|nr:c-type cytochrome [Chloroflexota bacterium]